MARHLGVSYLYEGEQEQTESVERRAAWRPEQFAALPGDLRISLHQACIELDTDRILVLIEQIGVLDASIGGVLQRLAAELDYDHLLSLLESDKAGTGDI
jgi:hypothetical protein